MTATDDDTQKVPTGRDAVDRLRSQGALDGLFEQIDVGQVKMTGADGLLPALVKEALERGLAAELTEHLGYEKGEPTSQARSNARNGTTPKTVDSEVGPFEIEVPRDRAGTFTPRLVRKGQRRLDGLDAMIISLYAGGMTVRDIQHHLASTLSVELSAGTISKITDAVADAVARVAARVRWTSSLPGDLPRARSGPMVRACSPGRLPLGPYCGRRRHGRDQARGLRIWVQAEEGASFWAHVCAELANRGVSDVLIVCCDGLTGLPEAIEATWPQATVQTCVVHLIRASMRFVSYGDRKKVAAALKAVYTAPSQEAAWQALTDFSESDMGVKYPQAAATWERAWERFIPFLDFPPMLRRVIYTTNSIESLNYQLRKVTKNRGHFPSDEAVVKLLWLAICDVEDKRARERDKEKGLPPSKRKAKGKLVEGQITTDWNKALAQLTTAYPDRFAPHL